MPYGVANPAVQPSTAAVEAMLDRAWEGGIRAVDTAPGYGEAETLLGHWIKRRGNVPHIATKLPGVGKCSETEAVAAIAGALRTSRDRLGVSPATYLTHDAADYLRPVVRARLDEATARGEVGSIGISAYADEDVFAALDAGPPQAIQIPINLFDLRMVAGGALAGCAANGVTVFARSVFLQGALLMAPDRLPPHLAALRTPLLELDRLCAETDTTRASLALRYVRDLPGVTSTVVGAYSGDQLEAAIAAAAEPPLSSAQRDAIATIAKDIPADAVDPRRWPKRA